MELKHMVGLPLAVEEVLREPVGLRLALRVMLGLLLLEMEDFELRVPEMLEETLAVKEPVALKQIVGLALTDELVL